MVKPLSSHEALELIDPPVNTPISVAEAKEHMRVDFADDDSYIGALIEAATKYVDATGVLGKALITQQWRQYSAPNPEVIKPIIGPVQVVNAVKYYDVDGVEQAANLTDFDVFGNGLATTISPKPGNSWPTTQKRPDAIWVEYTSGFGELATDVPATVRHAIKFLVAHWYENREPVGRAMQNIPLSVETLLGSERVSWYG